ncbi:MAG: hypothetical protein SVK08_02100 [Halobacteriota archaeon]|nr:hypothetical protein [Halobacteriota archaeon]
MKYKIGSKVTWVSSSSGVGKRKTGEVIHIVPPNKDPGSVVDDLMVKLGSRSAYGGGRSRDHESYLVLVPGKKKGHSPIIYWPKVKYIKEVPSGIDEFDVKFEQLTIRFKIPENLPGDIKKRIHDQGHGQWKVTKCKSGILEISTVDSCNAVSILDMIEFVRNALL